MITIKEVADLAGVSKATVSRVLNNSGYVSAETRKKITDVMEQHHYIPSATAVNLSKQESTMIGVVVPEIGNVFYADIVQGITEVADELELSLVLFDTQNKLEKEERALHILQQQRVRGIILGPSGDYSETEEGKELFGQLKNLHVPIVIVDRDFQGMPWDAVVYENYESSYRAALELKKAGNQTAGILVGDMHLKIARDRLEGFRAGAKACGLVLREKDILPGNFLLEDAYKVSKELLERDDVPEAMYSCNNQMTLGFMKAVREKGMEIGRDIAVLGNDRIQLAEILGVAVSCVYRDNYEMGRMALRLLNQRMLYSKEPQHIHRIPYSLSLTGSEKRDKCMG